MAELRRLVAVPGHHITTSALICHKLPHLPRINLGPSSLLIRLVTTMAALQVMARGIALHWLLLWLARDGRLHGVPRGAHGGLLLILIAAGGLAAVLYHIGDFAHGGGYFTGIFR